MAPEIKADFENRRKQEENLGSKEDWKSLKTFIFDKQTIEQEHAETNKQQSCHSLNAAAGRRYRCRYNTYSGHASRHSLRDIE